MKYKLFDFFSGCGGVSSGFAQAGYDVVFALDSDFDALESFKLNFPNAHVDNSDIRKFEPSRLSKHVTNRTVPFVFSGCAPCQPFSKQNLNKRSVDQRINLLLEFGRVISFWKPDFIFMENVPGLLNEPDFSPFRVFTNTLVRLGYQIDIKIIKACDFGVPQKRERLVLLASLHGFISIPAPTHGPMTNRRYTTVRDWIYDLPQLEAGQTCLNDPDHVASGLSKLNIARISCTPEGKGRETWPSDLILNCHKSHKGHTDVYGRLRWDSLASGLTTRCNSLSNGRFGHPSQNRAISIREAALLQTFPKTFRFHGSINSRAKQIGNAVPPVLAKAIAEVIKERIQFVVDNQEGNKFRFRSIS